MAKAKKPAARKTPTKRKQDATQPPATIIPVVADDLQIPSHAGQPKMFTYFAGLLMGLAIYSLVVAFWLRLEPPTPTGATVGQQKQNHSGDEEARAGGRNGPSEHDPVVIGEVSADMKRPIGNNSADNRQDAAPPDGRHNIAEWIIAIATVLALLAVAYQGYVMNRQIEIDNRAWLAIEEVKLDDEQFEEGWTLRALFTVQNLGRTPARIQYVAMHVIQLGKTPYFPPYQFQPEMSSITATMIAPNATRKGIPAHSGKPLTKQLAEDLRNGEAIQFQIVIKYLDVFDKVRFTVIAYNYNKRDGIAETSLGPVVME